MEGPSGYHAGLHLGEAARIEARKFQCAWLDVNRVQCRGCVHARERGPGRSPADIREEGEERRGRARGRGGGGNGDRAAVGGVRGRRRTINDDCECDCDGDGDGDGETAASGGARVMGSVGAAGVAALRRGRPLNGMIP